MQVSTTFPDSTYTSSNLPSADTLKADIAALETAHNDTDTKSVKTTDVSLVGVSFFLDEDAMTSNSAVKVSSQQAIKAYVDTMVQSLFPVGSIYTAVVGTNPATLLGFGTWEAFGAGRVIVGHNPSDTDFDTAEEKGGAKTVSIDHTHKGPSHTHTYSGTTGGASAAGEADSANEEPFAAQIHTHDYSGTTAAGGTGNTGAMSANATPSIVQPFIVAYMWKRTA